MASSLASLEEMETRLGVDLDPESLSGRRALAALDDASILIRSVAGVTWINDGEPSGLVVEMPEIIRTITLAVAMRAYRNPTGTTSAQVGDTSVTYGGNKSGATVYLTKDERRSIYQAIGRSTAGSVGLESDIGPRGYIGPDYYVPVRGGGDDLPMGPLPWEEE